MLKLFTDSLSRISFLSIFQCFRESCPSSTSFSTSLHMFSTVTMFSLEIFMFIFVILKWKGKSPVIYAQLTCFFFVNKGQDVSVKCHTLFSLVTSCHLFYQQGLVYFEYFTVHRYWKQMVTSWLLLETSMPNYPMYWYTSDKYIYT